MNAPAGTGDSRRTSVLTVLATLVGVLVGVAAWVAGGADDSPGLQLIGALLVVGAVVLGVRARRRSR